MNDSLLDRETVDEKLLYPAAIFVMTIFYTPGGGGGGGCWGMIKSCNVIQDVRNVLSQQVRPVNDILIIAQCESNMCPLSTRIQIEVFAIPFVKFDQSLKCRIYTKLRKHLV